MGKTKHCVTWGEDFKNHRKTILWRTFVFLSLLLLRDWSRDGRLEGFEILLSLFLAILLSFFTTFQGRLWPKS